MSIWVLIISFICLYLSAKSVRNLFKSNKKLQEIFIKAYDEGVISFKGEKEYLSFTTSFYIWYTILWVVFYIIAFNVFNYGGLVLLSLVAVFYLLQSIYTMFSGLAKLAKKEMKSGIVHRLLNVVEFVYIVYFIYYYVITRIGHFG